MHKMHDRSKEKNNPTTTSKQAHLSSNKRTGPFIAQSSLSTSRPSSCNINNNTTVTDEQQHRIALRAAKAMEKQLRRRQDRRSMFVWGDRKKAAIQRFPDGTFEIHVPQTLTPEQEQYEFPPRSRLLKKLASATAERRRVSLTLLEDDNNSHMPPPPPPIPAPHAKKPDQHAMDEWFSSCNSNNATTTTTRRRQTRRGSIFDPSSFTTCNNSSHINNVQQHRPLVPSPTTHCRHPTQQNYAKNVTMAPLQSITGQRWTRYSSLIPPSEDDPARKHYVPRKLLRPPLSSSSTVTSSSSSISTMSTISAQCRQRPDENKKRFVRLVDVFHQKLHEQQRLAHQHVDMTSPPSPRPTTVLNNQYKSKGTTSIRSTCKGKYLTFSQHHNNNQRRTAPTAITR